MNTLAFFPFSVRCVAFFALLYAVSTAFYSCSEVTQPEQTVKAVFTVQVQLRQQTGTTGMSTRPLPDVRVAVRRLSSHTGVAPVFTNARGEAVLTDDVVVSGDDFIVEAYSAHYGTRVDTVHGVCGEARIHFTFRDITVTELNCNTLANASALFLFTDNTTGSEKLRQNDPNPVNNCLPIVKNTGRDAIELSIPAQAIGVFTITGIQVDGNTIPLTAFPMRVVLAPGSVLALCASVATSEVSKDQPNGRFEENVLIGVQCPNKAVSLSLTLQATVEEKTCECEQAIPSEPLLLRLNEPVEVGLADTLSATVFTNTTTCPVTLRIKGITPTAGRSDWNIISPTALRIRNGEMRLEQGQTLFLVAEFRPLVATTRSTPSELRVEVDVLPDGNAKPCSLVLKLLGEACGELCPSLRLHGRDYSFGTKPNPRDSLYTRNDKRVFISDEKPNTVNDRYEFVVAANDSLVCSLSDASLSMEAVPGDQFSLKYFALGSQRVSLHPNAEIAGSFTLSFTAPTKQELDDILRQRNPGGIPRTADSMFTVRIIMTVPGCPPLEMFADAIVTTLPDFTPPIKLHAYRQTTPRQPKPEYEYYVFGESSVRSRRNDTPPPPNGPETGDLWVDVPSPNGTLPQQPFIKNEARLEWAYWQTIADESFFNNILQIVQQVEAGVKANAFTFNNGDITAAAPGNLQVGSVYIFRFSATRYAVMVVREINNGTEPNLNNQSAIHFRALSPVLINN